MADEKQAQATGVTQGDAAPDELAVEGIEVADEEAPEGVETEAPQPRGDASTSVPAAAEPGPQTTQRPEKTFTQADVERIVQERVAKAAKARQIVDYLRQMGWQDEDQILSQLQKEVNNQVADRLGVTDVNALRQWIETEVIPKHPVVQKAQQVIETSEMQAQVAELLKRYPDATDEEIRDAFVHMRSNGLPTLHAAYLDKFAPAIEEKIRKRALDAQATQAKRVVEGSTEAPAAPARPAIRATQAELAWAKRRVQQGYYKSVREALEELQRTKKG